MSIEFEVQYLQSLRRIQKYGVEKDDRTGTGTLSEIGIKFSIPLQEGFPLLTTKYVNFDSVKKELLWFLRGETNIKSLGCGIWNEWANENGDLGPIYGKQWRDWSGIDQVAEAENLIKNNPNSRRIIVNSWNVCDLRDMALAPCHCLYQFFVEKDKLSCLVYQRSADMFLGVPFNIASYALLTHLMAEVTGLNVGTLNWFGGDCHIYKNHMEQVNIQYSREPKYPPMLLIKKHRDHVWEYKFEDIVIFMYNHDCPIKAKVAI